jgi:uncharacterized protein (DUF58 family)
MFTSNLHHQVRRLQISAKRAVSSLLGGEYHSSFHGSGLAFEDVRDYQPGDDIRSIDWNVTARMGAPFIKRFVEERELTVVLAVDFSASLTGTKRTVAAELAALIAFAAMLNNDRVGLLGFTNDVEIHVPASKGTRHALRMVRDILGFQPRHTGTDLSLALDQLNRVHRRRVIVFLISDFIETTPPGSLSEPPSSKRRGLENQNSPSPLRRGDRGVGSTFSNTFRRTARQHELIAVRITDPLENAWPDVGLVDLIDPETGERLLIDTRDAGFRAGVERQAMERAERFRKLARSAGADALDVTTTGNHVDELVKFFRMRQKVARRSAS